MSDLWRFIILAKPDRWWLSIGAVLAALTLLAGLGLFSLSAILMTTGAMAGLVGTGVIINLGLASLSLRALAAFRVASRYAERMITHEATFRTLARLRLWVFERASPLAPGRLSKWRSGDLLSRVTNDVDALDNLYLRLIIPAFAGICALIFTTVILAVLAPAALPGVIATFLLSSLVMPWITAKMSKTAGHAATHANALTRAEISDLSVGLSELKAFGAQSRMVNRLDQASLSWLTAQRKLASLRAINQGVLGFVAPACFLIALISAHLSGANAVIACLSGFIAFALFEAATPLMTAAELYGKTHTSAQRLRELEHIKPTLTEPDQPQDLPNRNIIRFHEVNFTYPDGKDRCINQLNFTLDEGSRLGIKGPSGAGKSSLIKLIMKFYMPDSGQIYFDQTSFSELTSTDIRTRLAWVDQSGDLLSASIASNLRLANPDAQNEELWSALEQVQLAEFIYALPDRLNTWIGEQAGLISGGQARRLVLARAIIKSAPILLLDEPTESLDDATEIEFLDALNRWLDHNPRRSMLMISHRRAPLKLCNQFIQLNTAKIES